MKKLVALAVVALVVVGIVKVVGARSPEGKARTACENIMEKCDGLARLGGAKHGLTAKDADDCTKDLAGAKDQLGDSYNEMMSCVADADSCGEVLGCMGGAFVNEIGDQLDGMEDGFERMVKSKKH